MVVVASGMLQVGLMLGWPAILPSLQADNSTSFIVTDYDVKWLGTNEDDDVNEDEDDEEEEELLLE